MARENYVDVDAACPFYQGVSTNKYSSVICEGLVPGSVGTKVQFKNAAKRDSFKAVYCDSINGCKECPLAQALKEKYE